MDVDRLVLASAAGGAPATSAGAVGEAGEPVAAAPKVRVDRSGATSFDLTVSGADDPFWLVLGQSSSAGWTGTYERTGSGTSHALGRSQIVDGYANGWRLPATSGTYTVHLRWTPQRRVLLGLWLSLLGALGCLAIVLVSLVRRRVVDRGPTAPAPLTLRPWWATGAPAGALDTVLASIAVGLAAGLTVHPLLGLAAAAVTAAALQLPGGRLVGLGAPAMLLAAAAFTIERQWRDRYPPDFGWADFFGPANQLAWAALWLLVIALVTSRLRRREAGGGASPPQ
jgi:hypothetical protein